VKKYKVEKKDQEITVEIEGDGLKTAELHKALQQCREGSCDCPTDEYDKLESMQIELNTDRISLRLRTKPDADIDQAAVAACLDHTLRKSEKSG